MYSAQVDANGSLKIVWPRYDPGIIALGDAYIAFEGPQSSTARLALPAYDQVLALLEAAKAAAASATSTKPNAAASR